MSGWRDAVDTAIAAFVAVAELAGDPISRADIVVEYLPAPHRPPTRLPAGKMAAYGFWATAFGSRSGWWGQIRVLGTPASTTSRAAP